MERQSVFLATKMWPTDYGLETGIRAAQSSLDRLDTDYLGNELKISFTSDIDGIVMKSVRYGHAPPPSTAAAAAAPFGMTRREQIFT